MHISKNTKTFLCIGSAVVFADENPTALDTASIGCCLVGGWEC